MLDDSLSPVADGEVGEICVAGPGVAKGYLARPELTAERFVPNPFDSANQPVLYRSGDLGRRRGWEFFYVGRADRQVKVRGYRIELGEIERALLAEKGVAASHVMALDAGTSDARLVANIIPDEKIWTGAYAEAAFLNRRPNALLTLKDGLEVVSLNRAETEFMYKEIFEDRLYEHLGVSFRDGACVVDVGANIGMFCLLAMTRCKSPRLIAVEPIPTCAAVLDVNLKRYGADASVRVVGLSDHAGTAQFRHFHQATVMSGRYAGSDEATAMTAYLGNKYGKSELAERLGDAGVSQLVQEKLEYTDLTCPLETLSDLIEREGLDYVDVLKIDVEKRGRCAQWYPRGTLGVDSADRRRGSRHRGAARSSKAPSPIARLRIHRQPRRAPTGNITLQPVRVAGSAVRQTASHDRRKSCNTRPHLSTRRADSTVARISRAEIAGVHDSIRDPLAGCVPVDRERQGG